MLPTHDIQAYGGKAAILMHMQDRLPDLPIPSYAVKQADEGISSVLGDFKSMQKPVIVRSSSPHEYGNFEGIFESIRGVEDRHDLERAVRQVEESATSERAKQYAAQHGFEIDGNMHVIVQEQSPSTLNGAMMRHPNNPDVVWFTYFSGRGEFQQRYAIGALNTSTGELSKDVPSPLGTNRAHVDLLIDAYEGIESDTNISDDEVLFVEFGLNPFAVYQARPFKKIETADFELPHVDTDGRVIYSEIAFGITPPDGIVLPALRSFGTTDGNIITSNADNVMWQLMGGGNGNFPITFGEYETELSFQLSNMVMGRQMRHGQLDLDHFSGTMQMHNKDMDERIDGPYCLVMPTAIREHYDVDLTVPNMNAMVMGEAWTFLTHGLMRMVKQADVSVLVGSTWMNDFFQATRSIEDKVRVISNGKEALAFRE